MEKVALFGCSLSGELFARPNRIVSSFNKVRSTLHSFSYSHALCQRPLSNYAQTSSHSSLVASLYPELELDSRSLPTIL